LSKNTRQTPLYHEHLKLGAKMTDFAGWEMPLQYEGVITEHQAVRTNAGIFDLSHMGEFEITGENAVHFLNYCLTNNAAKLKIGQAQYTLIPYTDGSVADDAILYRLDEDKYLLVVNAANTQKDLEWLSHQKLGFEKVNLEDISDRTALIAIQGPKSEGILQKLTSADLRNLKYYHITKGEVAGIDALIARTGYTGEDGFEIFLPWDKATVVWRSLLDAGKDSGLKPAGLGSRDTLRIEAGMPLYGHELSEQVNPYEAGLDWAVKLDKGDFVGREALEREKQLGPARKLVGFTLLEMGVPRAEQPIQKQGRQIGFVTSGTFSPTLKKPIGMGYVPSLFARTGTLIDIVIRNKPVKAEIVQLPFYSRKRGGES